MPLYPNSLIPVSFYNTEDFNLDDYLFEYLENGYDIFIIDYKHILYIDLYINYNLEDIEHIDGLSKYIEYKEKVTHE